jgi:hemolysin activation/secretion protein
MRPALLPLLLVVAAPFGALAQPATPAQINPIERAAPQAPPRVAPSVQPPPLVPRTGPGASQAVRIGTATVSGNVAVPAETFASALAAVRGREVALAQVEEARIAILRAYRAAGFPFAAVDAGLTRRPDGTADLTFRVTEGYIAEVRLDGDIGPAGTQVLRFLNRLTEERPVSSAALERALLLASDIPGVIVRGVVRPLPGEPGALQLIAQVERRAVTGYINADNRGSRFAGPWQGLVSVGANALTEYGERTEFSLFGAEAGSQYFGQINFETFIGSSGLRFRAYAGGGESQPGSALAAIGYLGDTQVFGAGLVYPVIRRRPLSLFLSAQFDMFDSEVQTGTAGSRSTASLDQVRTLRLGTEAQSLDELIPFLPAGVTMGNVRVHKGLDLLNATQNGDPQSSRAGSQYDFSKITFDIQRTQPLFEVAEGWVVSLQGLAAGQYSTDVLPQVEKFYLGGSRLNRGFYAGQVTGDRAFAWGVELQLDTGFDLPGDLPYGLGNRVGTQFYTFYDDGSTRENVETDRNRRLQSFGLGVRMNVTSSLQVDLEGTRRETRRPDGVAVAPLREDIFFARALVRF